MIRRITPERPLKVLAFTDTHLDNNEGCYEWTLRLMRETIAAEKPDVVVFVGDNITGGTGSDVRAEEFTRVMTESGVPWCPVLGNHEGDNPDCISRRAMCDIFRTSPNCLMPDITPEGLPGDTNYAVPIYNSDGRMCHKLIFLDGGGDMSAEDIRRLGFADVRHTLYDYLKDAQIEWYRDEVRRDDCPSMVFCHIPLPEYRDAVEKGEWQSGSVNENICAPVYNSGMFDAMLAEGRSIAFIAGHDHINDFRIRYKGIDLIYNRMSGYSSYNILSKKMGTKLMQGCSVYTIDHMGCVEFGDIIYEDRYPEYHDGIFSVIRK